MKIYADIHTHSLLSGHAFSSLLENARGARTRGIKIMASTDHGPVMPGANPAFFHFANQEVLPENIEGVKVLKGVEANIVDDEGNVDLPDWVLKGLDIVLAGLHDVCISRGNRELNTRRITAVMESGRVDIVTHPGNPYFPIDTEAVVRKAEETGVLLELNNTSLESEVRPGSRNNCLELAQKLKERGLPAVMGSDAHWCGDVGKMDNALDLALTAGFREEEILNCVPGKLLTFLGERKKIRSWLPDRKR